MGGYHICGKLKYTPVLRFFDDNSWPMDSVKKQETMEELKDLVNEDILEQVFLLYCRPADNDDEDSFAVDQGMKTWGKILFLKLK